MNVPLFSPADDPGPDFAALMRSLGIGSPVLSGPVPAGAGAQLPTSHATTVVAVRYLDGVVMAGDRRATMGNIISHRSIEKVFPADRHSGVAIAGAAGPAMEMVKLFQLQLEHYEKVEGSALSLEGKANQLAQMVRSHLPAAMQGLAVVPLFAGYDTARGAGRLFQYDMTGGRYEETNFATTGSGGMLASTVIKVGFADDMPRDTAVDLVIDALFRAADDDSATGGPDLVRGIYPTVATITAEGFTRVGESEVANRFAELTTRLRLANPVSAETTDDRGDR
jgi:proteasome beta subunit